MSNIYEDEWWTINLPSGWSAKRDDDTVLIAAEDGSGLLQLRSFRSDDRDINDEDLKTLASHHVEQGAKLLRVRYGEFSGFYIHYRADPDLWWEWWLRSGPLALHGTYNCGAEDQNQDEASVARILGSVQLRDS